MSFSLHLPSSSNPSEEPKGIMKIFYSTSSGLWGGGGGGGGGGDLWGVNLSIINDRRGRSVFMTR